MVECKQVMDYPVFVAPYTLRSMPQIVFIAHKIPSFKHN